MGAPNKARREGEHFKRLMRKGGRLSENIDYQLSINQFATQKLQKVNSEMLILCLTKQ